MKIKWTPKYVKLTLQDNEHPWYIPEKNKRYGLGNVWYLVRENRPGEWEELYANINEQSSPSPLDVQRGNKPDLSTFDFEEISKKEAFLIML